MIRGVILAIVAPSRSSRSHPLAPCSPQSLRTLRRAWRLSGHFDADAANRRVSRDNDAGCRGPRSDTYFEGGYWLMLWDFVIGLLLAWALLGLAILGADAGLRRTPDTLSLGADGALCHSVFHTYRGY